MIPVEFCLRKSTTYAIAVVWQVQEKCLIVDIYIFMALLDLNKELPVPLESSESLESSVTQGVMTNALSHICNVYNYSQETKVNRGVHHRSALSTLLIILIIWCKETIDSRLESNIKANLISWRWQPPSTT